MQPNPDIRDLKTFLLSGIDALRIAEEKAAQHGDMEAFRSIGNQILEMEHRVRMLGRVEFAEATAALKAKLDPIIAARDDLKQAIADIDKLKAFVKSVSKFLALVDKLIDLLA